MNAELCVIWQDEDSKNQRLNIRLTEIPGEEEIVLALIDQFAFKYFSDAARYKAPFTFDYTVKLDGPEI